MPVSRTSRRPDVEERLAQLDAPGSPDDRDAHNAVVAASLQDPHCRVAARAAALAAERSLRDLVPQLLHAYPRFLDDAVKRDPQCVAKAAIARALVDLDAADTAFFLEGIRYRQFEPAWGAPVDTAVDVRCSCAMGLVASGYPRAIQELTALLADREWPARAGAVRAIACGRRGEAEAVLRLKVLVGDAEPEVIGECFTGLLTIAGDECLPLVASYLSADSEGVPAFAALALGESRREQALHHLRTAWDDADGDRELRTVLIRAAALHRTEPAFDWLLAVVETGTRTEADAAVKALSIYERNVRLAGRVQAALGRRRDAGPAPRAARRAADPPG